MNCNPTGIIITFAAIGKNLVLFQNVTIDMKRNLATRSKAVPKIDGNVTVYANVSII